MLRHEKEAEFALSIVCGKSGSVVLGTKSRNTKYWCIQRLSVRFHVTLMALLLSWEVFNSDPTHSVAITGSLVMIGGSESTSTPFEELLL